MPDRPENAGPLMGFSDDEPVIVMNRGFSQEMVFKQGMAVFMEKIIPDAELDCVGLFCPIPIALTKEEIEQLQPGQVLMVEADDPAAEEDIKRWPSEQDMNS